MLLTQQTVVKITDPFYELLDSFCFDAKNLTNVVLYRLRQDLFNNRTSLSYEALDKKLKEEHNPDYENMPSASTAQQCLMAVYNTWKGFTASNKEYKTHPEKYKRRPKPPGYLDKANGKAPLILTNQNVKVKNGELHFPKCFNGFTIPANIPEKSVIKQVRIISKNQYLVIEIVYEIANTPRKSDNGRILSIDLGLNNFATAVSNEGSPPRIFNGKDLKSYNAHWNKKMAHNKKVNVAMNGVWLETKKGWVKVAKRTKKQEQMTNKRNNKMKDSMHKISKGVVDLALERDCNTVIVGKNDGWKQNVSMGKKNNQTFVQIPHALFIRLLAYKCEKYGLNLIITEESYTSKTSWLDDELPQHHDKYLGKRVKRGLFISANGEQINADVNGALQTVIKVFPNAKADGIWAHGQPVRVNVI